MKARIHITGYKADRRRSDPRNGSVVFNDGRHTFADIKADGIGRQALAKQLRDIADRIEDQAYEA